MKLYLNFNNQINLKDSISDSQEEDKGELLISQACITYAISPNKSLASTAKKEKGGTSIHPCCSASRCNNQKCLINTSGALTNWHSN